jgi:hypothetical protein
MRNLICTAILLSTAAAAWADGPTTVPSPSPTTAPSTRASVPVDQSTPRGAVKVLQIASSKGDAQTIVSVIQTSNPSEVKVAQAYADFTAAQTGLRDALEIKFPPPGADLATTKALQMSELMDRIDGMQETITGDDAVVAMPQAGPQATIQLHRTNGQWKVPYSVMFTETDHLDQRLALMRGQTGVFKDLTAQVNQNKFASVDDFKQGAWQEMQKLKLTLSATNPSTQPTTQP